MATHLRRHWLLGLLTLVVLGAVVVVAVVARPGSKGDDIVDELERHAYPLAPTETGGSIDDLRPLGEMIGDAAVVGVGESTHSSREFFTLKHRLFRYLVEELGFATFALETNWSTGLKLNSYVRDGDGDARQIMREGFPAFWVQPWNTQEYLDLIEWMRDYNEAHPGEPVQFMAFDTYYPAEEVIDEVIGYVDRRHPDLLAEVTERYQPLRPTDLTTFMAENWNTPMSERRARAENAQLVLELLEEQDPGADPEGYAWAVQHARVLHQTARLWTLDIEDPDAPAVAMELRDRFMADNTVWWYEQTGGRILMSAHNGHVANLTLDPEPRPITQGAVLRERLGERYASIGLSFNQGSFNAMEDAQTSQDVFIQPQAFTLGPAEPGSHAQTLDQVRHRDYLLDLRTAPGRVRDWLSELRPSRDIGSGWPVPERRISLAASYDILIHLHEITTAQLLGPE